MYPRYEGTNGGVVATSSASGGAGNPRHQRSCGFLPLRSNYTPGGPGRIPPERSPGDLPPTAPRGSAKCHLHYSRKSTTESGERTYRYEGDTCTVVKSLRGSLNAHHLYVVREIHLTSYRARTEQVGGLKNNIHQ